MNRVAVAVTALLVLLSLTGCARWFHQDDVSEEPLREQIGDIASVVEVASFVDSIGAYVFVSVSELIESDLQAIVASADELLAGRDVTFKIAFKEHNLLTIVYPHEFSADELASEVHYWLELSSANEAPLGILLQTGGRDGPYRNIWDPDKTDVVNWDALRAVPDPSTAYHSWYLDGMVVLRSMPTADVLALRDRLATIELGADESLSLDYFAPGYVEVEYRSPEAGLTDPTVVASWPRVREIVAEIAALGLPQSNFVFGSDFYDTAAFLHLGDCADLNDDEKPQWASAELVTALVSAGIEFPVGVSTGYCSDFRN